MVSLKETIDLILFYFGCYVQDISETSSDTELTKSTMHSLYAVK